MAADRNAKLRNLLTGYSDSIRLSDIKANIAVLFVAIMMGTVLQFRDFYPWYLSLPVILAPFMIIFLNLLISVYPRYPRAGRHRFPIRRKTESEDFVFVEDTQRDLEVDCRSDAPYFHEYFGGKTSLCRSPMLSQWPPWWPRGSYSSWPTCECQACIARSPIRCCVSPARAILPVRTGPQSPLRSRRASH